MRRKHTKIHSRIFMLTAVMLMGFSMGASSQKTDTTYLHLSKLKNKNSLKTFHVQMPVMHTYSVIPSKPTATVIADDKVLSNVQVFPNPVTDQINLKYTVSRAAIVNIKIMDVLGNEVVTLFNQHVDAGEWKIVQSLRGKMNSGFYFVRVVVGTESVIKRISIL